MPKSIPREIYYTSDHEWIDFQGSIAYVGICFFKLKGFKKIHSITFKGSQEMRSQGDVIARVQYRDYIIDIHMPIEGKVLQFNDALLETNFHFLIDSAESDGWIAIIVPNKPKDRQNLLVSGQYSQKIAKKIGK
jgi:glycine cleavage system H protein